MKKFVYHLYYRLYWWNSKIVKDGSLAPFSTLLSTSMLKILNLLSILYIVFYYVIDKNIFLPKWLQTIIMISVLVLDYFIYIFNSKYRDILIESKKLGLKELRMRDFIVIAYIIITFALLIWIIIENFNR
jgi:hypothetical protein